MVLSLLLSTFLTDFIAELGDKTQLATLTISGTSNKPLAVFLELLKQYLIYPYQISLLFLIVCITFYILSLQPD